MGQAAERADELEAFLEENKRKLKLRRKG